MEKRLRNLFGTDPSIVERFFTQHLWNKKKNTRYISAVCRRNLDVQMSASYAAVNEDHDVELKKIDQYHLGPDGQLMFVLVTDLDRLNSGRSEWMTNCKSKTERPYDNRGSDELSNFIYTLSAEDYLLNNVFGHDLIYRPFINDLLTRLKEFAVHCSHANQSVLGAQLTGEFVFGWTTAYRDRLGPHIDSEPSLLIHVGGELPDGTKKSRGSGILSPRNIAYPDDDKIIDLKRVTYLRPGDFAICAGGAQARLTKALWRDSPDRIGGFHTNGVLNTGHPKEPVLPRGSTRRTIVSYAR